MTSTFLRYVTLGLPFTFVFLLTPAVAHSVQHVKTSAKVIPLAPCHALGSVKSCATFNEMVKAKDSDLIDLQGGMYRYVCFDTTEDMFFIILFDDWDAGFSKPLSDGKWEPVPPVGDVFLWKYFNGQQNFSEMALLYWSRSTSAPSDLYAETRKDWKPSRGIMGASISPASISLSIRYITPNNRWISEKIELRRSTLRYHTQFDFDDASSRHIDGDDGRCVVYPRQQ